MLLENCPSELKQNTFPDQKKKKKARKASGVHYH